MVPVSLGHENSSQICVFPAYGPAWGRHRLQIRPVLGRTGPIQAGSTQFGSFLPPFGSISGLFSTENAYANVNSNANSNGNQNANEHVNAHAAGHENENAHANSNAATATNLKQNIKHIEKISKTNQ